MYNITQVDPSYNHTTRKTFMLEGKSERQQLTGQTAAECILPVIIDTCSANRH